MTLDEFVSGLSSGMTIGIGGWGARRKPMALVRAILRAGISDLTVIAYGGPDIGMLLAAGRIRKLVYGFVSLEVIPVDPWFRKAREAGSFAACELDEGLLQWGLRAAGMRLPFLPTPVGLGSDVLKVNPAFRTVRSPYEDGEEFLAMPALKLDVALLHATQADRMGNVVTSGPDPFFDEFFARAADRCYVTTDALVDRLKLDAATAPTQRYERCFVTGVIETACGAHPTANPPFHGWDLQALKAYADAARAEGGWERYFANTIESGEDAYVDRMGGIEAIRRLPRQVF
jgi:glutaconate CoA-transferase subunit A